MQPCFAYAGRPNIGVDLISVKPKWPVVVVGLGMLVAGKTVPCSKRLPVDTKLTLPGVKLPALAQVNMRRLTTSCLLPR